MGTLQCYALLHGGGQGGWMWRETIEALRAQGGDSIGSILALDVPGCGSKRGRDTSALGPDDVAAELVSELEHAGLQDVVLVGHSMAGTILPIMAAQRPALFRRLVYVSACAPLPGQSVTSMMGAGAHGSNSQEVGWPLGLEENPIESQMQQMFCNDMTEGETASFVAQLGRDNWPDKTAVGTSWNYEHLGATRSSYVVCLRDGILPVPWQETFAGRLSAQRIIRVDAGHQVMNTRPHTLAEILRAEAALTIA